MNVPDSKFVTPLLYGRLCTIETPAADQTSGSVLHSVFCEINNLRFIETPYRSVTGGRVDVETGHLPHC